MGAGDGTMNIGIIPLDERPVNMRYPLLMTQTTEVNVYLPPVDILSALCHPADIPALLQWLDDHAASLDGLIVSLEMLGYGSLISSRISRDSTGTVIQRLSRLSDLKQRYPHLKIYGFNVITRISRHNDSTEEPDYWQDYGERLFLLSTLSDRLHMGEAVQAELDALCSELPAGVIEDFVNRRLRNHTVNLYALQLLRDRVLDLLVVSSDDTSPYGFGSGEKRWLETWKSRFQLVQPEQRLLMYPGADEVGCVLLARFVNEAKGRAPGFRVTYLDPDGADTVAAFEDVPVRVTVERQILAAGAQLNGEDVKLLINPPLSPHADWPRAYTSDEITRRLPLLSRLPEDFTAIADVAHSNGADREFMRFLLAKDLPERLTAFSGWNTAGNSIGTTVAAACMAFHYGKNSLFLAHRILEDYGYQTVVRPAAQEWLKTEMGQGELAPELLERLRVWIEQALRAEAQRLTPNYTVQNVRLPWQRTFEVDFDLVEKSL
jgi:hypothetical protein